jgi:hypothetical protein
MQDPLTTGYKTATITLVVELVLALGLTTRSEAGIFAMLAMVVVGVAWVPAAYWLIQGVRSGEAEHPWRAYVVAGLSGVAGLSCLWLLVSWTLLSAFPR